MPTDTPASAAAPPRRAAAAFIFVTILLDMLSFGMLAPVLPQIILGFEGGDSGAAAQVNGLLGFVWALMQFLAMPVMGALSDRFGRRPVILIATVGLAISFLMTALAPSLAWLFAARVISGITSANFATASAYIADVTPPQGRAKAFGMISAAFGLGFIIGPAVGGVLGQPIVIGDTVLIAGDPRLPFWVAAGLSLLNAAYGLFVLPESLPPERRSPFRLAKANPVGAFAFLRSRPDLFGFAGVQFLSYLAHAIYPVLFTFYLIDVFQWSSGQAGGALAMVGVTSIIVGAFLVQPTIRLLGERGAIAVGLGSWAAALCLMAFAPVGWVFVAAIFLGGLSGVSGPAVSAVMSRTVAATEQGALQGGLGALRGVADMAGPLLFSTLAFSIGRNPAVGFPGLPWLLAAVVVALAWAWAWRISAPRAA